VARDDILEIQAALDKGRLTEIPPSAMENVERDEDGGVATMLGSDRRRRSNRERSAWSKMVTSPSSTSVSSARAATAARSPNLRAWSTSFRLRSRTRRPSLYATIRQPSYFSPYPNPSRWKGCFTRVGCIWA
jgi:hypothetical protein